MLLVTDGRRPVFRAVWRVSLLFAAIAVPQLAMAADTDNDGLTDAEEVQYGTGAANPDTDHDGIVDGWEVLLGDDPLVSRYPLSGATGLWYSGTNGQCSAANSNVSVNGEFRLLDDQGEKVWRIGPQTGVPDNAWAQSQFTPSGRVTLATSANNYDSVGFTCAFDASALTCQRDDTSYRKSLKNNCINTTTSVLSTGITPSPWSVAVNNPLVVATARDEVCTLNRDFSVQCFDVSNWGGAASSAYPGVTLYFDADKDGVRNQDDTDDDNDGTADGSDADPFNPFVGGTLTDYDQDGVLNETDNCRLQPNADQQDHDGDGQGDACDSDDDNDTVVDTADDCPLDGTASAGNNDADALCDATDPDDDNDGVADAADNCALLSNADQADTDSDGQGDLCDADDDGDGLPDSADNCPLAANANQLDTDGDTQGNSCDSDDDNDGMPDVTDIFPLDDTLLLRQDGTAKKQQQAGSIAMADMNGDGTPDVLVGAPLANVGALKKAGFIRIVSGTDNTVLRTLNGTVSNQRFGTAMAVVSDQNADGVPDLLVGEPLADVQSNATGKLKTLKDAGRVALYSGSDGVFLRTLLEGGNAGDNFGAALATGDITGDAQADLVVGAPRADIPLKDAGQVWAFEGLGVTYLYTRSGVQAGERFGAAVAIDSTRLYVGAPKFNKSGGLADAGRVLVYDGSEGLAAPLFMKEGAAAADNYGAALAAGDGHWAVGVPLADSNGKNAGSVVLFAGLTNKPLDTLKGTLAGDSYGSALCLAADLNGDGARDLAIGALKFDISGMVNNQVVSLKDAGRVDVLSGVVTLP